MVTFFKFFGTEIAPPVVYSDTIHQDRDCIRIFILIGICICLCKISKSPIAGLKKQATREIHETSKLVVRVCSVGIHVDE